MQHPAPLGLCALTVALAVSSPSVCFLRFGGNCYLSTFAPLPVLQSRSYRGLESAGSTARRPSLRYLGSLRKWVQLSPTPGSYLFLAPPGQTLGCFSPPDIKRAALDYQTTPVWAAGPSTQHRKPPADPAQLQLWERLGELREHRSLPPGSTEPCSLAPRFGKICP